jgi:hypothetical protein
MLGLARKPKRHRWHCAAGLLSSPGAKIAACDSLASQPSMILVLHVPIEITFNDNYTTCEARVITAKQFGAELIRSQRFLNGRPIEIRSISVSGTTCTALEGNVFAQ